MSGDLKFILKIIAIVLILMPVWIMVLSFPWSWIIYVVSVIQIILALIVLVMESDAKSVQGASGWMLFGFICLNIYAAMLLGIGRVALWLYQYISS